jgi:hypothetical protein
MTLTVNFDKAKFERLRKATPEPPMSGSRPSSLKGGSI